MLRIILAATLLSLTAATMARADPCEGRLPARHGETFAGTVRYVGDGDSLCVGQTSNPNDWIEVRLADFDAPELREREGRRSRDILTLLILSRTGRNDVFPEPGGVGIKRNVRGRVQRRAAVCHSRHLSGNAVNGLSLGHRAYSLPRARNAGFALVFGVTTGPV